MPSEPAVRRSVLFVCTGNTCRSPLAEGLCLRLLADRLGCPVDELPARGFVVKSAGVMAMPGDAATLEAADVAAGYGVDLGDHRSRAVNPELLADATDVIAMTAAHAAVLAMRYPGHGPSPTTLDPAGDIADPIGGDAAVYRDCADTIRRHLDRLISEWLGQ
jgi:protein-tyrosine-phosphatase